MPQRIWLDGLDSLMQQAQNNGTVEDMLDWLKYAYDYIESLRKAAPDLESDWRDCQKGLDLYREELQRNQRKGKFKRWEYKNDHHQSAPYESKADILYSNGNLSDPRFSNAPRSHSPGESTMNGFVDPRLLHIFQPSPIYTEYEPLSDSSFPASEQSTPGVCQEMHNIRAHLPPAPHDETAINGASDIENDFDFFFDAVEWHSADKELEKLLQQEESHSPVLVSDPISMPRDKIWDLRAEILKCWLLFGQIFEFNIFVKVYIILSSCMQGVVETLAPDKPGQLAELDSGENGIDRGDEEPGIDSTTPIVDKGNGRLFSL